MDVRLEPFRGRLFEEDVRPAIEDALGGEFRRLDRVLRSHPWSRYEMRELFTSTKELRLGLAEFKRAVASGAEPEECYDAAALFVIVLCGRERSADWPVLHGRRRGERFLDALEVLRGAHVRPEPLIAKLVAGMPPWGNFSGRYLGYVTEEEARRLHRDLRGANVPPPLRSALTLARRHRRGIGLVIPEPMPPTFNTRAPMNLR